MKNKRVPLLHRRRGWRRLSQSKVTKKTKSEGEIDQYGNSNVFRMLNPWETRNGFVIEWPSNGIEVPAPLCATLRLPAFAVKPGRREKIRPLPLEVLRRSDDFIQRSSLSRLFGRNFNKHTNTARSSAGNFSSLTRMLFSSGQGEWQYSATLKSWRELKFLGFETGSGLENKDEILDALEVMVAAAQDSQCYL